MKWEVYLKQEVLDPLGMKSTWFWPTDKQLENKIELYENKENAPAEWREEMAWQQRPYNDSHVFASAGAGLWTTANDQLKFYKMLMNLGLGENGVRILKEETVRIFSLFPPVPRVWAAIPSACQHQNRTAKMLGLVMVVPGY